MKTKGKYIPCERTICPDNVDGKCDNLWLVMARNATRETLYIHSDFDRNAIPSGKELKVMGICDKNGRMARIGFWAGALGVLAAADAAFFGVGQNLGIDPTWQFSIGLPAAVWGGGTVSIYDITRKRLEGSANRMTDFSNSIQQQCAMNQSSDQHK